MTSHDWFIEHRTAFTIRSLQPEEERAFRDHLKGCEDCRTAIAAIEQELSWLSMGVEPAMPRPGLSYAMVERTLSRLGGLPRWAAPAALAAGVVLAAGAWLWAIQATRSVEHRLRAEQAEVVHELAMARDTLSIIREAAMVRHASISMGGHQGGLVIFADERTHRWNVVVYGLPAPAPGEVCQFWFITETGMVKGVEVNTGPRGPAFLTLPMPPSGGEVKGAALTIEAAGSTDPAPKGPELAHLMM
jgi:hypothetical protein